MDRIAVILQARSGSTRLPNKTTRRLSEIPMISHCIRRLKKVAPVVVATSVLTRDDPIAEIASIENVNCFRGSEEDVLDRYYHAAKKYHLKHIVRATADNPFVDPEEARRIANYILKHNVHYVTGIGLPIGAGVEAFSFEALERSWIEGHAENHREHVNEYILENPDSFDIIRLRCLKKNSCPDLSLTIDTLEDFFFAEKIIMEIGEPGIQIRTKEIIDWWMKQQK